MFLASYLVSLFSGDALWYVGCNFSYGYSCTASNKYFTYITFFFLCTVYHYQVLIFFHVLLYCSLGYLNHFCVNATVSLSFFHVCYDCIYSSSCGSSSLGRFTVMHCHSCLTCGFLVRSSLRRFTVMHCHSCLTCGFLVRSSYFIFPIHVA